MDMRDNVVRRQQHWLWTAVLAATPVIAASVLGNIATMPQINGWYATIAKPSFNPPNWVFGPVWTILFLMIGYAFYRVLRTPDFTPSRRAAIAIFLVQMALNAAWSWAFFAAQSPLAGLLVIAPLWLSIIATIAVFWRVDTIAGALLLPYLAWVSFASVLNFAIWRLNG
jgi:benzodiazapine receptor